MIDFENEHGIVENPNVKMLYEIVHDFLNSNSVSAMELVDLFELMKYEQLGLMDEEEDDDEI